MSTWKWYMSAAAMRQFMSIAGYTDDDGGPQWGAAEQELGAICESARLTEQTSRSGATIWRTGRVHVGPSRRKVRLELTVSNADRHEGDLPQLIRVRDRGVPSRPRHRGGRP